MLLKAFCFKDQGARFRVTKMVIKVLDPRSYTPNPKPSALNKWRGRGSGSHFCFCEGKRGEMSQIGVLESCPSWVAVSALVHLFQTLSPTCCLPLSLCSFLNFPL